jgi:hypothetical protein
MNQLRVKDWNIYQHYKPLNPKYQKKMTWFKFYGRDLLDNLDWANLSPEHQSTLVMLWSLASQYEGNLPDIKTIAFRLRRDEAYIIEALDILKGWIVKT